VVVHGGLPAAERGALAPEQAHDLALEGPRSMASLARSKSRPSRSMANMMRHSRWATATTAIL